MTALVPGNGSYDLTAFTKTNVDINGVSFVVFYDDGDDTNNRDFVIGCYYQDHSRRQDPPRHSVASLPISNEPNSPLRAWLAAGNDRANLPAQFAQPASQRSSHAPCPDDGQAIRHPVLG